MENSYVFFTKLIETLAIMLLAAAFAGSTEHIYKHINQRRNLRFIIIAGLCGGLFGIYGNISGIELNSAVISVRDIGPMLAGFLGGPFCGLIAGVVAGVHRLFMGGITAQACVVATVLIGVFCGLLSMFAPKFIRHPAGALLTGAVMESMHLGIVLLMVRPFETALQIVTGIALPFITVNAVGFTLMVSIIRYTEKLRKVSLERERLRSELEVANVIQHSLLPTFDTRYPGRSEISVSASMEAAKQVGGDFYDLFFIDKNRVAFLIGDVSGKGVPAALFMASAKIILQNCIRDIPRLCEAMTIANNVLCEKNEADMFVTIWVGVLDLQSGALTYCSAGHNPPALIHNGKSSFFQTKSGLVLAGMEDFPYKEHEMQLQNGDVLFLYTDGVTEATTEDDELYGEARLIDCLDHTDAANVDAIVGDVKNSIDAFVQDNDQFDDITMLCLKWNAPQSEA